MTGLPQPVQSPGVIPAHYPVSVHKMLLGNYQACLGESTNSWFLKMNCFVCLFVCKHETGHQSFSASHVPCHSTCIISIKFTMLLLYAVYVVRYRGRAPSFLCFFFLIQIEVINMWCQAAYVWTNQSQWHFCVVILNFSSSFMVIASIEKNQ